MTSSDNLFTPNHGDVAAKVIDGELIIIRLSDGTYYAMTGAGVSVWQLIEAGEPVPEITQRVAEWYQVPVDRVGADVRALVQELRDEELIRPGTPTSIGQTQVAPPEGPLAYDAPRLNIYRDMGNLLALDPPTPGIDDLLFRDAATD